MNWELFLCLCPLALYLFEDSYNTITHMTPTFLCDGSVEKKNMQDCYGNKPATKIIYWYT